jgi:4-amino-4-deoxy-L-arabinose transferase-like glycosyltransferase
LPCFTARSRKANLFDELLLAGSRVTGVVESSEGTSNGALPATLDRVALAVALPALTVHAALAGRYDLFRDELYFIVCGRHPAFGYVDQPPLIPLLAAGLYGAGHHLWILRLPSALAAAALVWLTVRLTRLLGGGDAAAAAAGIAAAAAPMFLGIFATLNTTILEPLAWTGIAYGFARVALLDDRRALLWSGAGAGLSLEAKYALVPWLFSLVAGMLCTDSRRVLARRELWLGIALATALAAPSIAWQAAHGWPFAEIVHAAASKNVMVPPLAFLFNQVLVMNPLFAPLWMLGIAAPFVWRDLQAVRFLPLAFVAVAALTILSHGKDYYLAAAYPAMFALGAIGLERLVRAPLARAAWLGAALLVSAISAPAELPILPPSSLAGYLQRFHLAPQQQERSFAGTTLPQEFADQLGWRDYVAQVGAAYASLTPAVRAHTAIKVDNYGEAAALDVLGSPYRLPPALSGHNQYYLWGLRGQDARHLLVVQNHPERLTDYCEEVSILGATYSPHAMAYENGKAIAFCREVKPPLSLLWPRLKEYQ